ncbi:hypothetical protein HPB50_008707 [Hyalomma asiaticum]|uniref:Uncharacterized protein n=1 Tax=Hyalomma asiaticum TaxID=266040 RepID=A0ACB7SF26_HYAAI|nr:hypothetical protein HPB50_008707 [Hyalomma asiaticum]
MGRADELKLEIEALKLQLELEKLKSARFLQNAAEARSETSGLGRYAKDLKAVLVPMPADDTMIPAWFKMADSLLKMLEAPEEMQGALILPFLTEEVKTSVVSRSLIGTFSYGELKEKVLKELKLTPTEYRRCFPEIKKEVREQSCDRTELTGPAITAEVVCVPIGLPCPSGNTRRVSLPVTPELATSADVLLTPGDYGSHCLAMSRSEHNTEGSNCGLVERSTEQDVVVTSRIEVDSATIFCDDDIARDAVGEEPNKGGEDNMCLEASLEPTHESEKEVGVEMSVQVEANPNLGYGEHACAAAGAAGDQAQRALRSSRRTAQSRTMETEATATRAFLRCFPGVLRTARALAASPFGTVCRRVVPRRVSPRLRLALSPAPPSPKGEGTDPAIYKPSEWTPIIRAYKGGQPRPETQVVPSRSTPGSTKPTESAVGAPADAASASLKPTYRAQQKHLRVARAVALRRKQLRLLLPSTIRVVFRPRGGLALNGAMAQSLLRALQVAAAGCDLWRASSQDTPYE